MSNSFHDLLDVLKQLCRWNTVCCTAKGRRFCDIFVDLCCVYWPAFGCWVHPKAGWDHFYGLGWGWDLIERSWSHILDLDLDHLEFVCVVDLKGKVVKLIV